LQLFQQHLAIICSFWLFYGLQNLWKAKHHLVHNRVRRGVGRFLIFHKLLCMLVYKDLPWCKSVCYVTLGIDPHPSLARSCDRWWLDFATFTTNKKSRFAKKRCTVFWTGAKIYFTKLNILGLGALLRISVPNSRLYFQVPLSVHLMKHCLFS